MSSAEVQALMTLTPQQRALAGTDCPIAFDNLTRQLYATDASIYQIAPLAVAFPRNAKEAVSALKAAAEAGVSVIPRGAGTGLVGGALGEGLVIDLARHQQQITDLDLERRTVRVGAGVVLDQLNGFLKPHGLCFGPDVATSSRATLGGMIANNSSGARVPVYGTTADHVVSLQIVLADGRVETIGPGRDSLAQERARAAKLVAQHASEIAERMPPGLLKRRPGYALDRFLRDPNNVLHLLPASEGTLAGILSAELHVVPLPREKGLAVIFFATVAEAMQATVELLDLKPAAIEHIDRVLFDQTKGQLQFGAARDLLGLDDQPCASMLIVEFYGEVQERLERVAERRLGLRSLSLSGVEEMNLVWGLRKAGLSLLTGRKGSAKPVTGVEDTAVRPEQLPEYVRGLERIMQPLGLEVCYYGHAAAGLLHVRPVLNLRSAGDRRKLRQVADEVSSLVRQFRGSLSAEHGVGMARTEYLAEHLGPELLSVMREIKDTFDPKHLLNPGKLIDDGRFKIDTHWRAASDHALSLPFEPVLAFARKDGSFLANLEQCNGCGGCRKATPTMCPTFSATGDESMSTRGRANLIRAVLERRGLESPDPLGAPELEVALSNCLACKACTTECPSNVNMALLKAELLHARHQHFGVTLRERLLSRVDLLGRLGCLTPRLANAVLQAPPVRKLMSRMLGISATRPLPLYARERFDRWFQTRGRSRPTPSVRGPVILWDDTFVRYHDPHVGIAAVRVLEAAGFEVRLLKNRQCCGRPAFSQGRLDEAARLGRHNLALLRVQEDAGPVVFLEPSCYSMFIEDYRELKLEGAEAVAERCFLFEQFVDDLLAREPHALRFRPGIGRVAIHAHCHAKSLTDPAYMVRLARHVPGAAVQLLETGCCGMAGAFGVLDAKMELSIKVAEPLLRQIEAQPAGTQVVASGTSCRHQIQALSPVRPLHMAEVLANALAEL
jgi:FAD/FMN-containing dehydrogenase/Fe-S oxidoreductase